MRLNIMLAPKLKSLTPSIWFLSLKSCISNGLYFLRGTDWLSSSLKTRRQAPHNIITDLICLYSFQPTRATASI